MSGGVRMHLDDSDTFIELEKTVDPTRKIHLILDTGSSRTSKQTRKWLAEHPRFTVAYSRPPAGSIWWRSSSRS